MLVIIVRLREARLATAGLIPAVLGTVAGGMSLLATDIASDVREIGSPTSGYKSSPWRGYSAPTSSSTRYERVVWFILGRLSDACARSVRGSVHSVRMSPWDLKSALASVGTSRGTLELI